MKTTVKPLNTIVNELISHQGIKLTKERFNDLFYYFTLILEYEQEPENDIWITYKNIKDFLSSLTTNERGTEVLDIIDLENTYIKRILSEKDLKDTINDLNDLYFYFSTNTDESFLNDESDRDYLSYNYKNIKDFLIDLYPYEIEFRNS